MNKRQVIHDLIDKLLDIDESETTKRLNFYFNSLSDCQAFDFSFSEGNGSREYVRPRVGIYFGNSLESEKSVKDAFSEIEIIKNTPDVEPKISVTIPESKARELGLIA